jgi:hypothetical protein
MEELLDGDHMHESLYTRQSLSLSSQSILTRDERHPQSQRANTDLNDDVLPMSSDRS